MSMEFGLFNLFMGPQPPDAEWRSATIGPFAVSLVEDYAQAVQQLSRKAQVRVSTNWTRSKDQPTDTSAPMGVLTKTVERTESVSGDWVVTATATCSDSNVEQSILAREPISDGGVWELCEILTFVTGRRVTVEELTERYDPNASGEPACIAIETLRAAALAWENRHQIATNGLNYALLSHNSAIDYKFLQPKAAQYNTALNVIIDKWPLEKPPKVAKQTREQLAAAIAGVVAICKDLTDEQRASYTALLRAKVMQGPYSLLDSLVSLLKDLTIIVDDDNEQTLARVGYLNTVRNRLTHAGEMPLLKNLDQVQSDRYTVNIVAGVLQELNQLAFGKRLGFSPQGLGSLSQHTDTLRRFFVEGVWNNHPLELMDFQDWISDPTNL